MECFYNQLKKVSPSINHFTNIVVLNTTLLQPYIIIREKRLKQNKILRYTVLQAQIN